MSVRKRQIIELKGLSRGETWITKQLQDLAREETGERIALTRMAAGKKESAEALSAAKGIEAKRLGFKEKKAGIEAGLTEAEMAQREELMDISLANTLARFKAGERSTALIRDADLAYSEGQGRYALPIDIATLGYEAYEANEKKKRDEEILNRLKYTSRYRAMGSPSNY